MTKNKYQINSENNLIKSERLFELNSFFERGTEGYFKGVKNINIYYKYFIKNSPAKGAIVISNGRAEAVIKYKETIMDFYNNGYSVYAFDHRGQGFSDRLIDSDPQLGYADSFENYAADLKIFFDEIVKKENRSKIFLLGHSMGGGIGLRYIEKFPNDFHAAAFTSPLLGLPSLNCFFVKFIFGKDIQYAKGEKSFDEGNNIFEENGVTNSRIRYDLAKNIFKENPAAKLGGASYRWVKEACKMIRKIFSRAGEIRIPILFLRGSDEMIVNPNAQVKFINLLKNQNSQTESMIISGARHELLNEKDEYRIPVLESILNFFDSK